MTDEECLAIGFDRAAFMALPRPYTYDRRQRTSLYVIDCQGMLKVGIAASVEKRLAAIQACNPVPLRVRHTREFSSKLYALMVEAAAHKSLAPYHLHGEWFKADFRHVYRILRLIYPCMERKERGYAQAEEDRIEALRRRYREDPAFREEHDAMMATLEKAQDDGRLATYDRRVSEDDVAALRAIRILHDINNPHLTANHT